LTKKKISINLRRMAASPEVMAALGGGGSPPGGQSPQAPPAAAPMMTPQAPKGDIEGAKVQVVTVLKVLEQALAKVGSSHELGAAILKAISALAKVVGKDQDESEELVPANIKAILQGVAGPGAPPKPPQGGPPQGAPPRGAPPPQ
jgi:hypothetical protein